MWAFTQEDIVNETIVKVMVLGDSGTGKSNLFQRILGKPFTVNSKPTAGIDFGTLTVKIATGRIIKAQIVDTSGLERFRSIIQSYWNLATGALIVYDVTNRDSFNGVRRWVRDFQSKQSNKGIQPVIMIIGNKSDCTNAQRQVSTHEAQAYALAQGFLFMECSALENRNVDLAFNILLTDVYYAINSGPDPRPRIPKPNNAPAPHSPISPQPRSSSLLASSAFLSPPSTPNSEDGPKHKSLDERLLDQARAMFSWMGNSFGTQDTEPIARCEGGSISPQDDASQRPIEGRDGGTTATSSGSSLSEAITSAVRGRLGRIGFDDQHTPPIDKEPSSSKLMRSKTTVDRIRNL